MADNSSQNNKDNIMKYKVCPPVADKDEIIYSKKHFNLSMQKLVKRSGNKSKCS